MGGLLLKRSRQVMFDGEFFRPVRWYYVSVRIGEDGEPVFRVAEPASLGKRPKGANPCLGNPYTPWYRTDEHLDESHVHIRAQDVYHAEKRARILYREKYG